MDVPPSGILTKREAGVWLRILDDDESDPKRIEAARRKIGREVEAGRLASLRIGSADYFTVEELQAYARRETKCRCTGARE